MSESASKVVAFVLESIKPKDHKRLWPQAEWLLTRIHQAHLRFIKEAKAEDYDEDDAFEAVYSEVLQSMPQEEDEDLAVAALVNAYFEALDDWNEAE